MEFRVFLILGSVEGREGRKLSGPVVWRCHPPTSLLRLFGVFVVLGSVDGRGDPTHQAFLSFVCIAVHLSFICIAVLLAYAPQCLSHSYGSTSGNVRGGGGVGVTGNQERQKRINIKKCLERPPDRIPHKNLFMGGSPFLEIKEKSPPPPHKEGGLSNLYARGPFDISLRGCSLHAFWGCAP